MKKVKFRWLALVLVLALVAGAVPGDHVEAAAKKYKITYAVNGGKLASKSPKKYTYGKGVTLKNPTRLGYKFAGWYANKKFTGKKIKSVSKKDSGNKKFYAKWSPNSYSIKFNGNGHTSGYMDSIYNLKYNESKVLPPCYFLKTDYVFVGWNTSKNGEGISFTDGQSVKGIIPVNGGTVTLYAQWITKDEAEGKPNIYRISYILNGGSNTTANPVTYTSGAREIILKSPQTRPGYTFAGWFSDTGFYNRVTKISISDRGDKTLFAKWNTHRYTVSFNSNGGTGTMGNYEAFYDKPFFTQCTLTAPAGQEFIGWSLYPESNIIYTQQNPAINLTTLNNGVVVLHARWQEKAEPDPAPEANQGDSSGSGQTDDNGASS